MNSDFELDGIIEAINNAKDVGIFTHVSPDGDAIGSSLGMYLALKQLGKNVDVITDKYSRCFNFLPCRDDIKSDSKKKYELAIALDCATKARLYDPSGCFDKSDFTVVIDHHGSNTYFGNLNYVEGSSPAVCKTLVKVFKRLNVVMSKDIGECLMAGIITDSGGFRYDTVDSETFEIASYMLSIGVNISDIYYKTFDLMSKSQFELKKIALSRLKFYSNCRIAFTYITQEDFRKADAYAGDHEGIVNIGRNIDGVEVSIFLREDEDGSYKVSLRSNRYVNVSHICETFDGGGHIRAAGCTFCCDVDEARKKLIREINKYL